MSDQYVFELQFKGKPDGSDYRENQFVIIHGSSMEDFSKLKEDLAMCMSEPFAVQYYDDEDDIICIDTEEEFQEFAKIARTRACKGMLMRLILNSNLPLDHGQYNTPPALREILCTNASRIAEFERNRPLSSNPRVQLRIDRLKEVIKAELRDELLSELKETAPKAQASAVAANISNAEAASCSIKDGREPEEEAKEAEYEEDSDGNMFVLPRKTKLIHYQKKLEKKEKKEKLVESKIDQRLEKLEMKRKKLMEKINNHHKMLIRKPVVDPKVALPMIMSAIVTKESMIMSKRVTPSKPFSHIWTIINDGTIPLNFVELRHTWSSPGLYPEETSVKLAHLMPGQEGTVVVRFKAPKIHNYNFISYWHFNRMVGADWQEFGHYVAMTGSTKPPKNITHDLPAVATESTKKLKSDQKTVSFTNSADGMAASTSESAPKKAQDEKVLNEASLSNITLKKQMEQLQATLASSEIAAEMAREAARLLAMASANAESNSSSPRHAVPKPSEGEKLNNCGLEEAAAAVQQLNLVDSESDTDANVESNEDSDRGFVIVTMTPEQTKEGPGNYVAEATQEVNMKTKEENTVPPPKDSNQQREAQTQPDSMPFPRLDPNVTYPVFPPPPPRVTSGPLYISSPLIPHNVCNYPVFPPAQNATSHGIVFPPPVNYSQIPTYPPIPAFPPAVPLPLTTQPPFVPVSQPPQLRNLPFPNNFPSQEKSFWAPVYKVAESSSVSDTVAPTDKPAETAAQEFTTVTREETVETTASAPSAESTQPQQQQVEATDKQKKKTEPVQILPQALVNGAINVAATAYSTAWNALNNLRPKEGEASEFDPVFENNMAILVEMGFNNLERNARLLKRFQNDISQVIAVICSTGGGAHNLDID